MMDEFVEVDPTGRYGRYSEILGKGASKIVYRAFDEYEGIEVAWNQVKLNDLLRRPEDLERLYSEIHLLKTLEHKHIMKFYTSWVDAGNRNINFVTELFTSGTLRQYRQKHKKVNIRAVKHWCRQILKGLVYLHSHDPPIIHRDLKCDNIFINGNQGLVKIGDLGLAAILRKSHAHCVGTPEFMAPEVYEEEYDELVDIYSFGMCVLEMVTFEYPYSECFHPVQIYKKVISGTKPQALYRIDDREVRQFIEKCLATASERLSAKELLNDPFLLVDGRCSTYQERDITEMCQTLRQPYFDLCSNGYLITNSDDFLHDRKAESSEMGQIFHSRFDRNDSLVSNGSVDAYMHETKTSNEWDYSAPDSRIQGINLFSSDKGAPFDDLDITINGTRTLDGRIFLRIRITDQEGHARNIHFPFDIDSDTAFSVATEMIRELDITNCDVPRIAGMISGEVSSVMSECKPGLCSDELDFTETPFYDNQAWYDSLRDPLLEYLPTYAPGLTSRHSGHFSGIEDAAMRSGFEERTYQVEGSEQCLTEGAPELSSCQSEALDLSSHGSRENHSDEEGNQLNQAVNNATEIHENSQTGTTQCVVPLHSSYISELRHESSSGNTADDHENKFIQELNGRSSLNPSPDFENNKSGMDTGIISSSHAPFKTSPEKSKSSFRLGKRFTFNFPPRRNLIPPDRNFTDSITRLTCSSTPVSLAHRAQHC